MQYPYAKIVAGRMSSSMEMFFLVQYDVDFLNFEVVGSADDDDNGSQIELYIPIPFSSLLLAFQARWNQKSNVNSQSRPE